MGTQKRCRASSSAEFKKINENNARKNQHAHTDTKNMYLKTGLRFVGDLLARPHRVYVYGSAVCTFQ